MTQNILNNNGLDRLVSKILRPDIQKITPFLQPLRYEDLEQYDEVTPDGKANLEDQFIEQERAQAMWEAVKNLPEADRDLLNMVVVEGIDQKVVAARLGIAQSNVSRKVQSILTHLRTVLAEYA